MNWNLYSIYNSDEIGGKQKNTQRHRRDEYSSVDPKRDKSKDKKRKFQGNREAKRNYED
jgi:hypothetical protein